MNKNLSKKLDVQFREEILDLFYKYVEKKDWSEKQKTMFYFSIGYPTAYITYGMVRIFTISRQILNILRGNKNAK